MNLTKILLLVFLALIILQGVFAENCGNSVILNTDCNMATQLIDSSNNPVDNASCDANLTKPDNSIAFQGNQAIFWQDGIYLIESDSNFSQLGIYIFSIKCVADSDIYFGSTEYEAILASTVTPDPTKCEISIIAKKSKKGNFQIFSASGFDSTRQSIGLSPTIEIFDLDSGIKTINEQTMQESTVPGVYNYYFNGVFLPATYAIKIDFDENCSKTENFEVKKIQFQASNEMEETETDSTKVESFSFEAIIQIIWVGVVIIVIIISIVVVYNKWKKGRFTP